MDPDGRETESIHLDKNGNFLAFYNDGDNSVYKHNDIANKNDWYGNLLNVNLDQKLESGTAQQIARPTPEGLEILADWGGNGSLHTPNGTSNVIVIAGELATTDWGHLLTAYNAASLLKTNQKEDLDTFKYSFVNSLGYFCTFALWDE